MAFEKSAKIWVDGENVPWEQATEHVMAHTLHYGLGAFEGIRAYQRADGRTAVFRLPEHIDRLLYSCKIATIDVPFSRDALIQACLDIIKANELEEAYLRPLVYLGTGGIGLGSMDSTVRTIIAAFKWGAYLGESGLKNGIRCAVSSYRRGAVDSFMSKGKICGQYVTNILAKREAKANGYDEALMLGADGLIAEGTGENIFAVKNGVVYTPPTTASILDGITRDTLITLARDAELTVIERSFTRDQMWTADEVFLSGTAAEVTPVREIDGRRIGGGEPGPVARRLQERFFAVAKGDDNSHEEWLTFLS